MNFSPTHIPPVKKSDSASANAPQLHMTFSKGCHYLKNRICSRRYWVLAAVLLLLFEICLIQWAGTWKIWKDKVSVIDSDIWIVDSSLEYGEYCLEFSPAHNRLKCINLVLLTHGTILGAGEMSAAITNADAQVLFETEISYKTITPGHYYPIEIPSDLLTSESNYYLLLNLGRDQAGLFPCLPLCNSGETGPEFCSLTLNGQKYDSQPLLKYVYETISWEAILFRILLLTLTFLGMAIGLPENPKIRRTAGAFLFLLAP